MAEGQTLFPGEKQINRRNPAFSPVGDLYAPFFDVAFYTASVPSGEVLTKDQKQQKKNFGLGAPSNEPGSAISTLTDTTSIGEGRVQLRSIGGGLQTYDPAGPDSPVANLTNYRAQLQITMLSAAALQATLTLTPPYEDAIRIIDHELIKFGSLMEIQWGYLDLSGSGSPVISDKGLFTITQPAIKFGRETTITIGGFDTLSTAMRSVDTRCHWNRVDYPCDLDILKKIIETRTPSLTFNAKELSNESRARRRKANDIVQADDDWMFFRRLCRQNDIHFEPRATSVYLRDRSTLDLAKRKYRLTWFMQPENSKDIPMMSFQTNPHFGYFAMQGSRGQRTFCRDADTQEIKQVDRSPSRSNGANIGAKRSGATPEGASEGKARTTQGDAAPFGPMDESCSSGRVYLLPCKRPNQTEEIDRENDQIRRNANTKATAIAPGVPGLVPQQIVCVANVGNTFSGNYRVMKVTHTIGRGYIMNMDLLRTATTNDKQAGGTDTATTGRENIDCEPPPAGELVAPTPDGDLAFDAKGCVDEDQTAINREATRINNAIFDPFSPPEQGPGPLAPGTGPLAP